MNPATLLTPPQTWQLALALAPAVLAAFAAIGACLSHDAAAAWRWAGRAQGTALAASVLGLASLAFAPPGALAWVRIDPPGAIVGLLVTFIGWVIVRYSRPYLDGERGEPGYVRALMAALAAVGVVVATNHLLVLALAWFATSLALHRLLEFFPGRRAALVAAHKKFLVSRLADICMLGAVVLLSWSLGTLRIDAILAQAAALPSLPVAAQAAAALVACAALLKCAQLPFHGWLIQVMEAPTPVSALLHAGIVNLGGFVLIRLAPLVAAVPAAELLLIVVGTATAVLAALVMTTRISIKVMLAWSTCAQMGFMLLQCGLGVWEMALLHLVAHSLYKAHAFLGAGGVVRRTQVGRLGPAEPVPGMADIAAGAVVGVAATAAAGQLWGAPLRQQPQLAILAGIVAFALAPLVDARALRLGGWRTPALVAGSFAVAFIWFALHAAVAGWVVPVRVGTTAPPVVVAFVAVAFLALFLVQSVIVARPTSALARALYPWFYGGLFLDERIGRVAFRLWPVRTRGDAARRSTSTRPAGAAQ